MVQQGLFAMAGRVLAASDVDEKLQLTRIAVAALRRQEMTMDGDAAVLDVECVGRPERPVLVPPARVPRRGMGSRRGRLAAMHAVAHIEFNAINLAWDAVHRFRLMPEQYYDDWVRVADDEARHFTMVRDYLRRHGCDYGEMAAHHGLWEMAERTADDVLERMALVPRTLEARGLDVTPMMIGKLEQAGDADAAAILQVIYREEIAHVQFGTRWFRHLSAERGLNPEATFRDLVCKHFPDGLDGPFNDAARADAGFSAQEMAMLTASGDQKAGGSPELGMKRLNRE
ncbi:MAG TPA: ferritin-like domain-containing protein [Mariprofundaceae bacterium]|nr:ferritin-like domain-containing protein [Mariprofundaceae bacterium]